MNKLIVFPLVIMFLVSIVLYAEAAVTPEGVTDDYNDSTGINIDGADQTIFQPAAGPQTLDIWTVTAAIIIIVSAIAIGIASGIQALGSGLSETSQEFIMIGFIYLGLWACLTVITSTMMFETTLTTVIWFGLSIVFMLGMAGELTGDD